MKTLWTYAGRVARLSIFVTACAALFMFINYRIARATVMEKLFSIGQHMAPYLDDKRSTEAPRLVKINGVHLHVAVGHTEHRPEQVKQWYIDRYAAKGDGLDHYGQELRKRNMLPPEVPSLNQTTFGNDQMGGVVALDYGDKMSVKALAEKMAKFAKNGKLGEVANLRYMYYEKEGQGTRFINVWTDERFDLSNVITTDARADAPGSDVAGVPRYPGTVRTLSGQERGMSQQLAIYDGTGSPDSAEMFYRARMTTLGWKLDERFSKIAAQQQRHSLRFENDAGREVVIDLSAHHQKQGLTVAVIQTH